MQKQLNVALVEAVALSPLLIIGLTKGVIKRNIRVAGRVQPVTGNQAVVVGICFIVAWFVIVSAPFWIEAVGRR